MVNTCLYANFGLVISPKRLRTDAVGEALDRQNGRSGALRIPTEKSISTESPLVMRDRPDSAVLHHHHHHHHSALGQPGRFEYSSSARHARGSASNIVEVNPCQSVGSAVKPWIGGAVRVACNDKHDNLSGGPAEHDENEDVRASKPKGYQRQEVRPSPLHTSVKDNNAFFEDRVAKVGTFC